MSVRKVAPTEEYFEDHREFGDKENNAWMAQAATDIIGAYGNDNLMKYYMEKYFDIDSFAEVTAMNDIVGMNDDWRLRHNFWFYVMEDENGEKKIYTIPYDYDRLNDEDANARGSTGAVGEWDVQLNANDPRCNVPNIFKTPEQKAREIAPGGAQYSHWLGMFEEFPIDIELPIQCDPFTRGLVLAMGDRIDEKTIELAETVATEENIAALVNAFATQLAPYQKVDPKSKSKYTWEQGYKSLYNHFINQRAKVLRSAQYGNQPQIQSSYGGGMFGAQQSSFGSQQSSFGSFGQQSFGGLGGISSFGGGRFG